ncbi:Bug family tripartite tricarboxylate transporter substrate binding protein [Microvirga sp. P5_D2]
MTELTFSNEARGSLVARRALVAGAIVVGMAASLSGAMAQDYPSKPIKLVVPGTAGGGMDVIARVVGDKVGAMLKQPVVVENKPGAGGNLAVDYVAKSPADGYTILIGQTAHFAINPWLYAKLPFDTNKDLLPVILLADAPNVMVVDAESPYRTLADVVKAAKESPNGLPLATPGNGTPSHMVGELFQKTAQIKLTHVPYKGAAAALTDVMGGRVPVMLSSVPTALSQIRAGKLRPVAVSADKRSPALPDVPTIGEQGYPGFNAGTWYGFFVPTRTPPEVVKALNAAANDAIKIPEVREQILKEGGDVNGGTPEAFAAKVKADYEMWGPVVKSSGATVD